MPPGYAARSGRPINADGTHFSLTGDNVSYHFHVDEESGDLMSDHFGGIADSFDSVKAPYAGGWLDGLGNTRREFPDLGRGDFRLPAIHLKHHDGSTVSAFRYHSHEIIAGKPSLDGLPATFGNESEVSTLIIDLVDTKSNLRATLFYSIFPKYNAIARHFEIMNEGLHDVTIERASSFSVDLPNLDLNMVELWGDQAHEMNIIKRNVDYGETSFRSTTGYSSYLHNPFFALVSPTTTEKTGEAWGFSLVYSGSFAATASRFSHGFIRVLLGLNPLHSSVELKPGEKFTSPEAVAIYSSDGLGSMSRSYHDLYRNHLSRSIHTFRPRPTLLNSWEALYFNYDQSSLVELAGETADLGINLFVTDDGWFGNEYPRMNSLSGLGDWVPNSQKFPQGLGAYVDQINNITVGDSQKPVPLKFGLWIEPEMVNPRSTLYKQHPEWVLHAGQHERSTVRHQLVLNMALPEVQDYVLDSISKIIDLAKIDYIKWDNNRAIHEMPSPSTDHSYILGLYRVIDTLTAKYPHILWEGCASGGARFDAGFLHYWPQSWASDNTDAADRLSIQMGTSLVYPLSTIASHISAVPNHLTGRVTSIEYRAHVAMWCGSFGFELNPADLSAEDRRAIPRIIAEAAKVHPLVLTGSFHRLRHPQDSNWPAVQLISKDGKCSAVFAFQQLSTTQPVPPPLRLEGLDSTAQYQNDLDDKVYSGSTYMNAGLELRWRGDYQSKLIWLNQVIDEKS